jgi:hypothetical protein
MKEHTAVESEVVATRNPDCWGLESQSTMTTAA